jgi:hypothetical protein
MQKQAREFISTFSKSDAFSVTLSMKQSMWNDGCFERLDDIKAQKNMRHFLNRLNRSLFGNAAKRYGKKVEVIPVLEKSPSGRLHYHLTIKNPNPSQPFIFQQKVKTCWFQTMFADNQFRIEESYDVDGWNDYITKTKVPNIDWENYYIA